MTRRRDLIALALFGLAVAVIAALGIGVRATYGAQVTADEPQYLLSAMSLWEDGNLDISDELEAERYRDFHEVTLPQQTQPLDDGSRMSPHNPLLPVLLALPFGLGGWVGAKAALAGLGGVLAALTAWTATNRFGVSRGTAYLVTAIFALAPPLAVYSTQVYPALPGALALLAGFAAVTGPFERRGQIVLAVSVIALPWLAVKFVPLAAVLALAGIWKAGRSGRIGLLITFGVAGIAYVLGHLAIYDGITPYAAGDHFVGGELTVVGSDVNLWGRSTRLLGLLVDRGFGLGAWQPAFLVLPLLAGWGFRQRREGFVAAGWLIGVGWLVATFVALTMHGWWFPGRQVVVILPIAVLLVVAWADESRRRVPALTAAGVLGVVAFGFLMVEGLMGRLTWVVDFGGTVDPFYRAVAMVMPDYLNPSTLTWVLHGVWVTVALGLVWVGWRGAGKGSVPRTSEVVSERNQERVLT